MSIMDREPNIAIDFLGDRYNFVFSIDDNEDGCVFTLLQLDDLLITLLHAEARSIGTRS